MVLLERALTMDAHKLAEIQKVSFDEELQQFNHDAAGPSGYDSSSWQAEMMNHCDYYKILVNGAIVGGVIILIESNQVHNLGRIFIDPSFQNQGIGVQVMSEVEERYPNCKKWWLDTPRWSIKNHHFYAKCGFTKVREEGELYIFEKSYR